MPTDDELERRRQLDTLTDTPTDKHPPPQPEDLISMTVDEFRAVLNNVVDDKLRELRGELQVMRTVQIEQSRAYETMLEAVTKCANEATEGHTAVRTLSRVVERIERALGEHADAQGRKLEALEKRLGEVENDVRGNGRA